jgi:hypothetical protein
MEKIAKNTKRGAFTMNYKKILIPFLAMSVLLISGCGKKKETRKISEPVPKEVLQPQNEIEDETEETSPPVIKYIVKLSGKTLSLYEVNGEVNKMITSMEINPELYPEEDTIKLKAGIEAYCKEDGYAILENFVN